MFKKKFEKFSYELDSPYYEPTHEEKQKFKKKFRKERIESVFIAIIWAAMAYCVQRFGGINMENPVITIYIAMGIVAFIESALIKNVFNKMIININNCEYTKGVINKTWYKRKKYSDSSSIIYFAEVILSNGAVIPKLRIDYHLFRNNKQNVIIAYRKNKFVEIINVD